jgi:hypothetical protein
MPSVETGCFRIEWPVAIILHNENKLVKSFIGVGGLGIDSVVNIYLNVLKDPFMQTF